jgi:hypothetical protein
MKKLAATTALAVVLAGSAYAQGHHHGGSGAGMSGSAQVSGGGAAFNGGEHVSAGGQSMMSGRSSGQAGFGNSERMGSSRNAPTVFNQERSNRSLYNRYDENRSRESFGSDRGYERFGRDRDYERFGRERGPDMDFRHRGVVRGNFFEHGRRFGFRRFWHNEWVYLTDWDSCTAWAWVAVAPGVFAWRPIDVCVG